MTLLAIYMFAKKGGYTKTTHTDAEVEALRQRLERDAITVTNIRSRYR